MKFNLILVTILAFNSVNAQKNFIDHPYVETSAKVDTSVTPDEIYLTILIAETDTKGKVSIEELEQNMVSKLMSMGIIVETQLVLSDLSSNFKNYFLRKEDIQKSKSFELRVSDAKTAGQTIYELETIGISNVNVDRVEYSGLDALLNKLRTKAILLAKTQALSMVEPLSQKVGRAILISDIQTGQISTLQARAAGILIKEYASKQEEYYTIPVEFEKVKVESSVRVVFTLDPE
jgi:uncharacterized protein YggE